MRRLAKSRTWVRSVRSALGTDEIGALIAKMSVLFEDLRIEHYAATRSEKIDGLDTLQRLYRQFYFVRRSTIALVEFIGAFEHLNNQPGFAAVLKKFAPDESIRWETARSFFNVHKPFLKEVRNDYGGHFQLRTARAVLDRIPHDEVGSF